MKKPRRSDIRGAGTPTTGGRKELSMATKIRDIIPPHEPRDAEKLAALIAAYGDGAEVPPIVVIDWTDSEYDGRRPSAISGSHRLAALLDVYDDEQPISIFEEIEMVSGEDLIDALTSIREEDSDRSGLAASALDVLADLGDPFHGADFGALCGALVSLGVLPEAAAAALVDQVS